MRHNAQGRDFDFVPIGFKPAVRRSEAHANTAQQVQTERLSYFGSEDTKCGSGIDAGHYWNVVRAGSEIHGECDAFIAAGVIMDAVDEFKLVATSRRMRLCHWIRDRCPASGRCCRYPAALASAVCRRQENSS